MNQPNSNQYLLKKPTTQKFDARKTRGIIKERNQRNQITRIPDRGEINQDRRNCLLRNISETGSTSGCNKMCNSSKYLWGNYINIHKSIRQYHPECQKRILDTKNKHQIGHSRFQENQKLMRPP